MLASFIDSKSTCISLPSLYKEGSFYRWSDGWSLLPSSSKIFY